MVMSPTFHKRQCFENVGDHSTNAQKCRLSINCCYNLSHATVQDSTRPLTNFSFQKVAIHHAFNWASYPHGVLKFVPPVSKYFTLIEPIRHAVHVCHHRINRVSFTPAVNHGKHGMSSACRLICPLIELPFFPPATNGAVYVSAAESQNFYNPLPIYVHLPS